MMYRWRLRQLRKTQSRKIDNQWFHQLQIDQLNTQYKCLKRTRIHCCRWNKKIGLNRLNIQWDN